MLQHIGVQVTQLGSTPRLAAGGVRHNVCKIGQSCVWECRTDAWGAGQGEAHLEHREGILRSSGDQPRQKPQRQVSRHPVDVAKQLAGAANRLGCRIRTAAGRLVQVAALDALLVTGAGYSVCSTPTGNDLARSHLRMVVSHCRIPLTRLQGVVGDMCML